METCGLISCIVPVYNGEKWLKKCIQSIRYQTYENIEILLINDGSKDRSEEICLRLAKKDARIRYFSHPNHGVSYTRNRGIDLAEGEYLCFVDCDDILEKNAIQTLIDTMNDGDAQLAVGAIETVSKYSAIRFGFESCVMDVQIPDEKFLKFIFDMRSSSGYMAAKLYQSKIIRERNLRFDPEISCYEDALFTYEYIRHCKRCAVTDKVVYFYNRMNESAVTGSGQAFQEKRYIWENEKICCQWKLFDHNELTKADLEYIQEIVFHQYKNMCAYYAKMAPNAESYIRQIQAGYGRFLGGIEEQYRFLSMPAKEVLTKVSETQNTAAKLSKWRRIRSAIIKR